MSKKNNLPFHVAKLDDDQTLKEGNPSGKQVIEEMKYHTNSQLQKQIHMSKQWQDLVKDLKAKANEKGITQQQIQEQSGLLQPTLSRFFGLKYKPTLETFNKVANAIGYELSIQEIE